MMSLAELMVSLDQLESICHVPKHSYQFKGAFTIGSFAWSEPEFDSSPSPTSPSGLCSNCVFGS